MGEKTMQKKDNRSSQDSSMDELADLLAECLNQEQVTEDWEPIEAYVQKLRTQFYHDTSKFHHRFVQGYETLLNVIQDNNPKKSA